jgi:hypothetical protein
MAIRQERLTDRAFADMQQGADRVREMLVETVARNHGVDAKKIYIRTPALTAARRPRLCSRMRSGRSTR